MVVIVVLDEVADDVSSMTSVIQKMWLGYWTAYIKEHRILQQAIKCCYHDIELCLIPYFGAKPGKMFILKVYIYLPCINTQQQATAQFNDTPVISPPTQSKH